jgi:hypothetical protein
MSEEKKKPVKPKKQPFRKKTVAEVAKEQNITAEDIRRLMKKVEDC